MGGDIPCYGHFDRVQRLEDQLADRQAEVTRLRAIIEAARRDCIGILGAYSDTPHFRSLKAQARVTVAILAKATPEGGTKLVTKRLHDAFPEVKEKE